MTNEMKRKRIMTAAGCGAVYLAALAVGAWLLHWLYDRLFGADAAYALENTPWLICAMVPAVLFLLLIGYQLKTGHFDSMQTIGITAVFLMLLLAAHFMAGLCVDQVDEDGVSKYLVRRSIHYSWADVDYYTLAEKGGEIQVTLVMDDETRFVYGDGLFGSCSDAFAAKYPNDTYDFWPYAAAEMKRQGVKAAKETDWDALEAGLTDEASLELIQQLKEINETAYYL